MEIFLIIAVVAGIFISLYNLYVQARIIATLPNQLQNPIVRTIILKHYNWLSTTLPILSTILILYFQHWIFTIGIFLSALFYLYQIVGGILKARADESRLKISLEEAVKHDIEDSFSLEESPMFPKICGIIGKVTIVFGAAIIMTLSSSQTVWSWSLLMFVIAGFVCTLIANFIVGAMVTLLAILMTIRKVHREKRIKS